MARPTVAVAIPAHDEAEAIGEFIAEIDAALAPRVAALWFVVVDDGSSDGTADVVAETATTIDSKVIVVRNDENRGHGATVLAAYRSALDTGADLVLQVDGDGQFLGSDLRRVTVLLDDGAAAVCGVRRFRYDPWLRMVLTRVVRTYVGVGFGVPTRDANCPLRGYRAELLDELLSWVPADALVPNLYLTILAARRGVTMVEVDVNHRVRRGRQVTGSMFAGRSGSASIRRLSAFALKALLESRSFHRDVNSGRRPQVSAARR